MARGKRTGGPKTQAGKIASSKNALKTGAYSMLCIPNNGLGFFYEGFQVMF